MPEIRPRHGRKNLGEECVWEKQRIGERVNDE